MTPWIEWCWSSAWAIVSAVFVFVHGMFELVQIGAAGLVVALVLGLLRSLPAGWMNARRCSQQAPVSIAAALQLVLLAGGGSGFLGGNPSAFSLWLGLGVGLVVVGLAAYLRRLKRAGRQLTVPGTPGGQLLFDQRMRDRSRALRPRGSGRTLAFHDRRDNDFIIETAQSSEELRNRFGVAKSSRRGGA